MLIIFSLESFASSHILLLKPNTQLNNLAEIRKSKFSKIDKSEKSMQLAKHKSKEHKHKSSLIEDRYKAWLKRYKSQQRWGFSFGLGLQSFFGTGDLYFLPRERFGERELFKDKPKVGKEIYIQSKYKFIPQFSISANTYYKVTDVTTIKFGVSGVAFALGSNKYFTKDDKRDQGFYELNKSYEINANLGILWRISKKLFMGPKLIFGAGMFPCEFEFSGQYYPKDLNIYKRFIYQGGLGLDALINIHKNFNLSACVMYVHTPVKHLGQPRAASNERLLKLGINPNHPMRKYAGAKNIRIDTTPLFLSSLALVYRF